MSSLLKKHFFNNTVITRDMRNQRFENINTEDIAVPNECFRLKKSEGIYELFRVKKHLAYIPRRGENRWVVFPVEFKFEEGCEYSISFEIKSTYRMKRTVFLRVNGHTKEFDDALSSANQWEYLNIKYVSKYSGQAYLVITASDLPAAGHYLWIRDLSVSKK